MKLAWTPLAVADRMMIFDYIELRSPAAAARIDSEVMLAIRRLAEFPESGRIGRVAGTRELVIPRTPYIAAYTVLPDRVRILRILHGAQIWPDEIPPS